MNHHATPPDEPAVCDGCGTSMTAADIKAGGYLSCCPERKMLTAQQWRERALKAEADIKRLREAEARRNTSFKTRWNADRRAIARWQAATGQALTWPDHADLVVFLLARLADAEAGRPPAALSGETLKGIALLALCERLPGVPLALLDGAVRVIGMRYAHALGDGGGERLAAIPEGLRETLVVLLTAMSDAEPAADSGEAVFGLRETAARCLSSLIYGGA